jgi:hypothetical protein
MDMFVQLIWKRPLLASALYFTLLFLAVFIVMPPLAWVFGEGVRLPRAALALVVAVLAAVKLPNLTVEE